jgi:hypothetical protein
MVDGDLLVGGTTESTWPEDEAEMIPGTKQEEWLGLPPTYRIGHEDAFLVTLYPDGRFGNWMKQLRSPGNERILAIAAETSGGAAFVAGVSRGGFTQEPGVTPLTSFGGDDAILLKVAWGRSAALCYRGSVCEAGLDDGVGFQPTDYAMIGSRRCGRGVNQADGMPDTPADGSVVVIKGADSTRNQRYQWGDILTQPPRILLAKVGRYVLCWCAGPCAQTIPMEVAVVQITGPDGGQKRDCTSGEPCDTTGIQGRDLSAWDKMAIMPGPCGTGLVRGFPRDSITEGIVLFESRNRSDKSCNTVATQEMDGVASNFGCGRVTAGAGIYRMCWCSDRISHSTGSVSQIQFATSLRSQE